MEERGEGGAEGRVPTSSGPPREAAGAEVKQSWSSTTAPFCSWGGGKEAEWPVALFCSSLCVTEGAGNSMEATWNLLSA